MKTTTYVRRDTESLDDISSLLEGRVFHVTKLAFLEAILTSGEIRANGDGSLQTTFGYTNGFFRKRNCVSLFDHRRTATDEIRHFRTNCWPLSLAHNGIAILLLIPDIYDALIPWTRWKEEEAWCDQVVPHVEAGYKESVSTDFISEVICLTIEENPNSPVAKLRAARHTAN